MPALIVNNPAVILSISGQQIATGGSPASVISTTAPRVSIVTQPALTAPAQIYFPVAPTPSLTPNTPSAGIYRFNDGLGLLTDINTNASALQATGGTVQSVLDNLASRLATVESPNTCVVSGSASVTIAHNTWTTLAIATSVEENTASLATGNSTITLNANSFWRVDTIVSITTVLATGSWQVNTNRAAQYGWFGISRLGVGSVPFQDAWSVRRRGTANDVISVRIFQNSGASVTTTIALTLAVQKG